MGTSRYLEALFVSGAAGAETDGELLDRFRSRGDVVAFEVLVKRHGGSVWAACRAALRDEHDAEDAFQATFLILARRAGSIRDGDALGRWLRGVAARVAARARRDSLRREARERRSAASRPATASTGGPDTALGESLDALREEVNSLPKPYRDVVVRCYLEGRTCEQTAAELRRPVGTITVQLSRARRALRDRLARRGFPNLSLWVAWGGTASPSPSTTLPKGLIQAAVRAAVSAAPAPGASPGTAAALAEGVLKSMTYAPWKTATLALAALSVGSALTVRGTADDAPRATIAFAAEDPPKSDRDRLQGTWVPTSFKNEEKGEADDENLKHYKLIFSGDKLTMVGPYSGGDRKGTITLDPKATPKTIDVALEAGGEAGVLRGLYKLDGDTLTLCYPNINQDRPVEFAAENGAYLWVFKRSKD
jgi:RNA polymerase sigma-70 factor (ECF subfamily)